MKQARVVSVTSGKGGVGKTSLIVNMAIASAKSGKKVLIFDGDLGMANVDIFFGLKSHANINDLLSQRVLLQDVLLKADEGVYLISGGNGILEANSFNSFQRRAIVETLGQLSREFDLIYIDTAPGIGENVLSLNAAADLITVLITPDPSSFADAYSLIKVMNAKYKENRFAIVCNMVRDEADGYAYFERFNQVADRFLNISLDYVGSIPLDPSLRRSNAQQRIVLKHDPQCVAGRALMKINQNLINHSVIGSPKPAGGVKIFWEQVMGVA